MMMQEVHPSWQKSSIFEGRFDNVGFYIALHDCMICLGYSTIKYTKAAVKRVCKKHLVATSSRGYNDHFMLSRELFN
jgi:hypothetical protein